MSIPLTAAALKTAAPGTILRDTEVPGLQARMDAKAGGATFTLSYRTKDGRERRPKLGRADLMTLGQARARARDMLLEVAWGKDPAGDVAAARAADTVNDLCNRYVEEHVSGLKPSWRKECTRIIDKIIRPRFGTRKATSFTREDLKALRKAMADAPIQFNRVCAVLSKLFNLAETDWHVLPAGANPCKGIKRYKENKRRRYATIAESRAIATALQREAEAQPFAVAFVRLCLLTGARPGEIAAAKWTWLETFEIDGAAHGVIRHPDAKTGARDIYLAPMALAVLEGLPRTSGTILRMQWPKRLWNKIRVEAGCPDLRPYDLRHNFASVMISAGYTLGQIGELLGHKTTQTTQRYAHLMEEHKHAAAAATVAVIQERMACTTSGT